LLPRNASNRAGNVLPVAKLALKNQGNERVAHFLETESLNQLAKLLLNVACHRREQFNGNWFPFLLPTGPAAGRGLRGSFPLTRGFLTCGIFESANSTPFASQRLAAAIG
jgi:hypothetical protein